MCGWYLNWNYVKEVSIRAPDIYHYEMVEWTTYRDDKADPRQTTPKYIRKGHKCFLIIISV